MLDSKKRKSCMEQGQVVDPRPPIHQHTLSTHCISSYSAHPIPPLKREKVSLHFWIYPHPSPHNALTALPVTPTSSSVGHTKSLYFEFLESRSTTPGSSEDLELTRDPKRDTTAHNDPGTPNVPGFRVRKQTRNIVTVMRKCEGKGRYYLFLEDDMRFCPSGLQAIQYLLDKAR